ncbi:unnamed protein product, partial [Linum tenue]
GTVDVNIDTVAGLRSPENPRFLVEIIDTFVAHSATVVDRLESEIMGGGRVAAACLELRRACDDSDKQRYLLLPLSSLEVDELAMIR